MFDDIPVEGEASYKSAQGPPKSLKWYDALQVQNSVFF